MTTQPLLSPIPLHLQPSAKASSTAKSSNLSAIAGTTPASSRSSSRARPVKQRQNVPKTDFTSENATLSLIRRVLSPQNGHASDQRGTPRPIEDLLPPLTSFNEVDIQLYAIIAIVLKDFVYAWYGKITPDHVFVEEVVQIIAHTTRALEQRLRRIDLEGLVLDEIPAVVIAHILAYQAAHETSPPSAYGTHPWHAYHALNPHPALSPIPDPNTPDACASQGANETLYRQLLVQGALAVLLPTEDLDNACLRTLVGDVVAELILGQGISAKACEGWFVHEAITKIAEIVRARLERKATGEEIEVEARSRLERFGLLSSKVEQEHIHSSTTHQSLLSALFWRILQYGYLLSLFIRFMLAGMSQARYLPPRSRFGLSSDHVTKRVVDSKSTSPPPTNARSRRRPIVEYRCFTLISTILDLSTRMPWLAGFFSMCQHFTIAGPGRLGRTDSLLDKFLSSSIRTHILPPSILPPLLLNLRIALFPSNAQGPPALEPPSSEERLQIRRRCAEAILSLVPPLASHVYFNVDSEKEGEDEMLRQVEDILDVFGDVYCNKHLVYNILELVIVRLVPELGESTPSELLSERGVLVAEGNKEDSLEGIEK